MSTEHSKPNALRPRRVKVQASRPRRIDHDGTVIHSEREILVNSDGDVREAEYTEAFACGCRSETVRFRCSNPACRRLVCTDCPNAGHSKDGKPLCGACSRVVRTSDGREHRMTHEDFRRNRQLRRLRRTLRAVASLIMK